jgi:hypothetical protein
MNTELCQLAYKYGTDKCPQLHHSYTPIYYELLKDKKHFKKILEIGIGNKNKMQYTPDHYKSGGSLRMWRDFFSEAQIYGVDYDNEVMFSEDRIQTFLYNSTHGDQMQEFMEKVGNDFDLVIDDGNHRLSAQFRTLRNLMPYLKKDVIYVVEDSKSPERFQDEFPEYECQVYQNTKHKQDSLVIIRNK